MSASCESRARPPSQDNQEEPTCPPFFYHEPVILVEQRSGSCWRVSQSSRLRGEPGPDAELWLLDAFGGVLLAEIRTLDRLRDGGRISRQERRELRERLLGVPAGLPDGEAVVAALLEYVG
jgi:hypothetical protein